MRVFHSRFIRINLKHIPWSTTTKVKNHQKLSKLHFICHHWKYNRLYLDSKIHLRSKILCVGVIFRPKNWDKIFSETSQYFHVSNFMIFITGQSNRINFRWSNWISLFGFFFRKWDFEIASFISFVSKTVVNRSVIFKSLRIKKLGVYNVHKTKPIFITPKSALFSPFLALIKHFFIKSDSTI